MKDDLISRRAAIDALMVAIDDVGILDGDDINTVFDNLPSAQPELIRCQDCKFGLGHAHNVRCDKYYGMGGYDDFCSRAERKDDATD